MLITLVSFDKFESEIAIKGSLVPNTTIVEYNKRFYVFNGLQEDKDYRPRFQECHGPVFIG